MNECGKDFNVYKVILVDMEIFEIICEYSFDDGICFF